MSRFDELFEAAKKARLNAHAPYSRFAVGAAVLTDDGRIFAGCNVENASFPEGWCAETTAIGAMVAAGGRRIVEAVVTADAALCTPCGGCRQRLAEFAPGEASVHVCDTGGLMKSFRMADLLPAGFVLHGEDRKS
ncbi:cytidine deaminase [Stappia sp. F7233]|uniref:Cytidine deaminase n=1 Tax=Stappia albiluteola TaxID=2758565 RepID=A0A839AAV1_9HYPH|nr:cytidine deaminase [Stappia albiluteola]MBA5776255.1 cytidine deaminase [Stappia albiluteola]